MIQSNTTIASLVLVLAFSTACSTTDQSKQESQSPAPGVQEGTQNTGGGNTTGVSGSTPDNNASMGGGTDSPSNENIGSGSVTIMDGSQSPQASPTPAKKKTH